MAKGVYPSIGGVVRTAKHIHMTVGGAVRKVTHGHITINSVIRQFFDSLYAMKIEFTTEEDSGRGTLEAGSYFAGPDGDTWKFSMNVTNAHDDGRIARVYLSGLDFSGRTLSFKYTNSYSSSYCTAEVQHEDGAGKDIRVDDLKKSTTATSYSKVIPDGTKFIRIGLWIGVYDNESTLILQDVCIDGENIMNL